jgi:hypothetical protein
MFFSDAPSFPHCGIAQENFFQESVWLSMDSPYCLRLELSKGYRMMYKRAVFDIVYRTQQVEFARRDTVRNLNDEHCCPQKNMNEEQATTLECIIR